MYFFVKTAPGTASLRQKACCIQSRWPVVSRPGPCPSSAEWAFEVDTCCGSPERACHPPKSISSWAGLRHLPLICCGPCKPSPAAASSGPSTNQRCPPLLWVRAGCAAPALGVQTTAEGRGRTWKRGFPSPGAQPLSALGASTQGTLPAVLLPSSDRTQHCRPVAYSQSQFKLFSSWTPAQEGWEARAEGDSSLIS